MRMGTGFAPLPKPETELAAPVVVNWHSRVGSHHLVNFRHLGCESDTDRLNELLLQLFSSQPENLQPKFIQNTSTCSQTQSSMLIYSAISAAPVDTLSQHSIHTHKLR